MMTPAAQFLLDALIKELAMLEDDPRPNIVSTFLRRLRNQQQRPQPAPVTSEPYRLPPMAALGLRCPKCGKLIDVAYFNVHSAYCHQWAEWSRKK